MTPRREMLHEMLRTMVQRTIQQQYRMSVRNACPAQAAIDLREWSKGWYLATLEAYWNAINEDDSLIGKQWAYDQVCIAYKLPWR